MLVVDGEQQSDVCHHASTGLLGWLRQGATRWAGAMAQGQDPAWS